MRRGRRWLEGKLWSGRSQVQAAGSLRQTLTEVRQALHPDTDIFGADRLDVWLDANRIVTDLAPGSPLRAAHRDLLEG
ncbi:hypothetical protein Q4528_14980, partial [Staphylococcus pasteuri_A]|nr:hypothetical protein [Staphylococcus pasteuri_A]